MILELGEGGAYPYAGPISLVPLIVPGTGSHISSDMRPGGRIYITRDMGPGGPKLWGAHFSTTPAL